MSSSEHVISLNALTPDVENGGSSVTTLSSTNFPLLDGLSLTRTIIAPGMAREPHWYVAGNQLAYNLGGTALVTLFLNASTQERFVLTPGQMYYVPAGAMQAVENISDEPVEIISALTASEAHSFGMSGSLAVFSDAVIGNAFGLPADTLAARSHAPRNQVFSRPDSAAVVTDDDRSVTPYKFDIEAMSAPVDSESGWAKTARAQFWPVLQDIAMYSVTVTDDGMREPHWHPATVEMGYVAQGMARMTVLDPDGTSDTYLLTAGDVYFVPRAYPHQIEDIGDGPIHFCIFFDRATPGDIGYRAALTHLRRDLVAAAFGMPSASLPDLPFTSIDPLIVPRVNPLDPIHN